jgi:hypothetical protein
VSSRSRAYEWKLTPIAAEASNGARESSGTLRYGSRKMFVRLATQRVRRAAHARVARVVGRARERA